MFDVNLSCPLGVGRNMYTYSRPQAIQTAAIPGTTLRKALTLFETVGMPARNLSLRTRAEYHHDLSDLIELLEEHGVTTVAAVCLQDMTGYRAEMDKRGYKPSTRNRKTHPIKNWFKFPYQHSVVAHTVTERSFPPRAIKPEPRLLSEAEYHCEVAGSADAGRVVLFGTVRRIASWRRTRQSSKVLPTGKNM
jgi:hypothetical protein